MAYCDFILGFTGRGEDKSETAVRTEVFLRRVVCLNCSTVVYLNCSSVVCLRCSTISVVNI